MMKKKKVAVLTATAAFTALGLAFSAIPAQAEAPVSPGGYTLAGSDTIQDVVDALVNGTTVTGSSVVQVRTSGVFNASYDAFPNTGPGSYIQTHSPSSVTDPTYFLRPSGSGDGINSMIASNNLLGSTTWKGYNVSNQVDIARSSSGPKTVQTVATATNASLVFVPFARDAVSYAYVEGSSWDQATKDAWAAIDQPTLKAIYQGSLSYAGITARPLLPQSTSGTRKFFLGSSASQGVGIGNNTTPAGVAATVDENYQENTATVLTVPGEIIPFSAASWIAQSNGAIPFNSITAANTALGATGTVKLGNPNVANASAVFDTTTNPGKLTPVSAYYSDTRWGRNTYLVAPKVKYDNDAKLHALLDPTVTNATSLTGFGSSPTSPGAVKKAFGFLAPLNGTTPVYALAESY